MAEETSLDILGIKPLSKAAEKIAEKSVDGPGLFFGAICLPAAEEFGLLLRDKVAAFRRRNIESIADKSKRKIEQQQIAASGDANPRLLREIIEDGSWCDDEDIQSMWAGLLAIASGNRAAADDSLVYTDTLKRLTPFQARLINCIYCDPRCCSIKTPIATHTESVFYPENHLVFSVRDILTLYPGDLSEIVPIAYATHEKILKTVDDHTIAISRFRPQIEAIETLRLVDQVMFLNRGSDGIRVLPSFKGLDFYMRCLGYSVYPLEAFILTLQRWCQLRGIDPFTYRAP